MVAWQLLLGDMRGSVSISRELIANTTTDMGFTSADITHAITRDGNLPYGGARGSENIDTDRGWLGQAEDTATGLTYLNARYYDPDLARFLSPDPLMDPGDPRTLDPYRYADNNPALYTDASGLTPKCGNDLNQIERMSCYMAYGATQVANTQTKDFLVQTIAVLKEVSRLRAVANVEISVPRGARNVPNIQQTARTGLRGASVDISEFEAYRRAISEVRWKMARATRIAETDKGQLYKNYMLGTDLLEMNAGMDAIWNQGGTYYNSSGMCAMLVMECILDANFDYGTITLGHTVVSKSSVEGWGADMAKRGIDFHEYGHVLQVESQGSYNFYPAYGIAAPLGFFFDFALLYNPDIHDSNPYEKSADKFAAEMCGLYGRKACAAS